MQFTCESLNSSISPSLSETRNDYNKWIIAGESDSSLSQTPKRLKRKTRHSNEIKVKRYNPNNSQVSLADDDLLTERKDESDNNFTINSPATIRKKGKKRKNFATVETFFSPVSSSPHAKNVSLEELMETTLTDDVEVVDVAFTEENSEVINEIPAAVNSDSEIVETSFSNDEIEFSESENEQDNIVDEVSDEENSNGNGEEKIAEQILQETADTEVCKLKQIVVGKRRLVVLEQNTIIYLYGVVRIKVLRGCVEVLGYALSNTSKPVDLYSPKGTSLLYLKPIRLSDSINTAIATSVVEDEELHNFIEQQTYDSCVIECEGVKNLHITYIEKHIAQHIYPKQDNNNVRYIFQEHPRDWNVIKTNSDWDIICDTVAPNCKVFLCGGKGVGKSTFLRYAINKLLMKYEKIRVVDLDPGQPEFTVPGCVSVHTIIEPVFGPNYTHIRKPEKCIFLPNVNIAYNPKEYIQSIQELLSFYRSAEELPTLFNYMGFSLAIGLNIACSVIAEIKPTTVVQIQSSNKKKNFSALLTPECVIENMLLPSCLPVNVSPEELSYQFITLQSLSDDCSGLTFQPRQIREMCALAYMSQVLPDDVWSLTDPAVRIYRSNLQNCTLIANGVQCHPAVINGKLVALCVKHSVRGDCTFYRCFGWGVVRGVDLDSNELFLITPESNDTLELLTHLIYGSVNLPPSVYMTADDVNGVIPYVSLGTLASFSSIPKRTHLPKMTKKR